MSALKPPLPLPRPSAADRTRLPAALTALLIAGWGVLLALPGVEPLPDGGPVAPLRLPVLADAGVRLDPVIVQRTLFSPTRRDDAGVAAPGAGVAVAAPLGGARIAGVAISPGRARVFVVAPDGKTASLARGAVYQGWQLVAVGLTTVRFARAGDHLDLAVGSVAARAKPAETPEEPLEDQP